MIFLQEKRKIQTISGENNTFTDTATGVHVLTRTLASWSTNLVTHLTLNKTAVEKPVVH